MILGRNSDGTEKENATPVNVVVWLSDTEETCTLDPAHLALPYVTSVATSLSDFMDNDLELSRSL